MKTLVIGDIHGCHDELLHLLDLAGLAADDTIISRGPATPAVLKFFRSSPRTRVLMGNHERKHVRSFRREIAASLSQRISRRQIGEAQYTDACAWMSALPRFFQLPEASP